MKTFVCDYNFGKGKGMERFTITEEELPKPLVPELDNLAIGEEYVYPSFGISYKRIK